MLAFNSAVPVFAPIFTPSIFASCAVPFGLSTTCIKSSFILFAASCDIAFSFKYSTFKPVTGAIGITEGKINPKEDFGRSGLSWQKDSSWGSYMVTTLTPYNEPANMQNALIRSDNIYFAKVALNTLLFYLLHILL